MCIGNKPLLLPVHRSLYMRCQHDLLNFSSALQSASGDTVLHPDAAMAGWDQAALPALLSPSLQQQHSSAERHVHPRVCHLWQAGALCVT